MEEHVEMALEIVKAQAGFRAMTEEEICNMVRGIAIKIQAMLSSEPQTALSATPGSADDRTPKNNSITCLECMKSFKMLTHKHLATHDLTPDEYRAKWGYPKDTPLVCKALQRTRRKKMKDIRLWEKRRKATA